MALGSCQYIHCERGDIHLVFTACYEAEGRGSLYRVAQGSRVFHHDDPGSLLLVEGLGVGVGVGEVGVGGGRLVGVLGEGERGVLGVGSILEQVVTCR